MAQDKTVPTEVKKEAPKEIKDQKEKDKSDRKNKIRTPRGVLKSPYEFKPRVFIGGGMLKSFTDLKDDYTPTVHTIGNRYGWDAGLSVNLSNNFDLSFSYMNAKLTGNENATGLHRNFETKFSNLQLGLTYNFRNLLGRPTMFYPFVTVGVAYMQYKVNQDLANGDVFYHYWTDGFSRAIPQDDPERNTYTNKYNDRDNTYETAAYAKTQTTFAVPLGAGIGFNLSKKVALKLGSQYYFSFADNLDAQDVNLNQPNPKNLPTSNRKGNDGYFYTYANISYNFYPFRSKPDMSNAVPAFFADFGFMNTEDADGDGVIDLYDKCLGTPKLLAVDGYGCPLDKDQDGIADYLDKEVSTSKLFVTDIQGKAIDQAKLDVKEPGTFLRQEVTDELIDMQIGKGGKPANYNVHVGTYGRNMSSKLMAKLNSIEGLVETKINDSLTVYTIGNYSDFVQAEAKQNQLIESGYDQAFGVNEKKLTKVSTDLNVLANKPTEFTDNRRELIDAEATAKNQPKVDKLLFKVELTEYRLRIGLEKLATIIATYGVEMHSTTGGLKKYTIGGFNTPAEAEKLRMQVEQVGLKEAKVAAYLNDTYIEMDKALDMLNKKK